MIDGKKVLSKGDAARGSLHKDTYYGAIEKEGEVKYVKRIAIEELDEKSVDAIVDENVVVYNLIDFFDFFRCLFGCIYIQVVQATILLIQLKENIHKYGFDLAQNFLQEI